MHHPAPLTVSASYALAVTRAAASGLVEDTDLALTPTRGRVGFEQLRTVWARILARSSDPHFGLHMGEHVQPTALNVLGHALLTASTLGEAADLAMRYTPLVSQAGAFTLQLDGRQAILYYRPRPVTTPMDAQQIEAVLATVVTACRWLAGRSWTPVRVSFTHSRRHDADEYTRVLGCPVTFDAKHYAVTVQSAHLNRPLPHADRDLAALHRGHADRMMAELMPVLSVREQVAAYLAHTTPALARPDDVARRLHMSTRSLRRALHDDGTTWRQLVDHAGHQRALTLLRADNRPLDQIAHEIGLSDAASLVRAFKRWQGTTPGAYRVSAHTSPADTTGR
ncbi:AraC family transcriptional regulator [Nocardia xishanensis]|uniref:AraC family transcriptional regulator n=1 Tax=Nocardia xishanensis TaxID=238964 RepID=A0ABW7X726_9NOCA